MALYKCYCSAGQTTLPYFLGKCLQNKIIQSSDLRLPIPIIVKEKKTPEHVHDISKPNK